MEQQSYEEILKKYWGYGSFRSIQKDIICSIGEGRDTLGLMPTGGGKSITFQVPALSKDGICIVVTPLVALMKDQVAGLRKKGILAHAIHSALKHEEILAAYDNCICGMAKFLYVSPERLQNEFFLNKVAYMQVSMLVVDEAHCISQWGYDFRPAYLRIAEFREMMDGVPLLALTATATPRVADDIMKQLHFAEPNIFKMSFERANIAYIVRHTEAKEAQMVQILKRVPGSAIVYVRSRRRTKEYAEMLRNEGFSADFFHAGLDTREKDRRQEEWTKGNTKVIVCTNAFGMGIDKPDVRLVIHTDPPDSLEAYYQEAGRAGRDGEKAYAVFLWSKPDAGRLRRNVTNSFPPLDFVVGVYNSVCDKYSVGVGLGGGHSEEFNVEKFCDVSGRQVAQTVSALAILSRAGYMHYDPNMELASRLMFLVERGRLYSIEEAYPHLSEVIKSLLRLYTGLFVEYAMIDEDDIARMCGMPRQHVYDKLLELSRIGVVSYNPQKHTSFVTWLQDREVPKYMSFPRSVYEDRLTDAKARSESVISYCTSVSACRSRILLEYFGQVEVNDCGHCDVCLGRSKDEGLSEQTYSQIARAIRQRLALGSVAYDKLCVMPPYPFHVVAAVVRDMLDNNCIVTNMANFYSLPQNKRPK